MLMRWPASSGEELALAFDQGRTHRVLVLPPLFEESNKLRRLLVGVMRRLDAAGIDVMLPDLPGQNESLAPLATQTLSGWRDDAAEAANHFAATHCLAVRASAALAPQLPGWDWTPFAPQRQLKAMLRARTLALQEAGEKQPALNPLAAPLGAVISGYHFGPQMLQELASTALEERPNRKALGNEAIAGRAPWLRAEPDYSSDQADALAAIIALDLAA